MQKARERAIPNALGARVGELQALASEVENAVRPAADLAGMLAHSYGPDDDGPPPRLPAEAFG